MEYQVMHMQTRANQTEGMGTLSFAEQGMDIPFEIRRMYHIYGVKGGIKRGFHAHKENKQFLFCPYGKINIILDDGRNREEVLLDSPSKALIIFPGLWREMVWLQDDSVLCVAASEHYEETEYIRDYHEFLTYVGAEEPVGA